MERLARRAHLVRQMEARPLERYLGRVKDLSLYCKSNGNPLEGFEAGRWGYSDLCHCNSLGEKGELHQGGDSGDKEREMDLRNI